MPFLLEMHGITKSFPGVKALQDVTMSVAEGEVHAICGENGAGKSTLMKILSGVYPSGSYEGEIVFDGQPGHFRSIRDSEDRGIVIIHQELALSPFLSIAENIFLGNEQARRGIVNWPQTNKRAAELLARVGLAEPPDTKILDIGVGKQQLVEIAKALSKRVRLLILDEPTAALNDADSEHLLGLIRQLKGQGITSIIISHKLNEIAAIADTTTVIRDGRTVATFDMHGAEPVSEEQIIRAMVGRDLAHRYPEHTPQIGEEVLRIEDWTVHHPIDRGRVVVDKAALRVRGGEIVGIAGLMGAGRTELAMSVFGHSYGTGISGRLFLHGKEVRVRSVDEAIGHGIAYATEDRKRYGLNLIEDIKRNITAAKLAAVAKLGVVNSAEEVHRAERLRKEMRVKADSVAVLTGKLSGGNQQKVVLSKWLFTEPEVLILDEPTRGIDVGAKYEIYEIINALADAGKAVVVISSELPELLGICDRIYAMSQGRITGEMDRAAATQEGLMRYMTMDKSGVSR
ncbi:MULTISPECIES: multiple monosaccharide ABC transporter ATP-binding protein [Dactylosporangium]|uniref:Xylose ABC transporter ATP-binding protein n=2 Tax=Dactylosporangium TaxID=35753 RepID=A0A9W6NPX5_9ACTN|nr:MULTISPECIES: multiple monosaccharide ABC transporter ATP-binding protein [Dactylosporangium]UAB99415.1 ATP-binding cassette domain-containing protein [Dactylosporangium vinaceum]UWZ47642.1 ATP-binding cassette domain-containing protein [Dactylosporangium matsuzakiense]GLL05590.1 xylose ABC transporter ATP-binding protein [Dactylosporangium matsuzakiense]